MGTEEAVVGTEEVVVGIEKVVVGTEKVVAGTEKVVVVFVEAVAVGIGVVEMPMAETKVVELVVAIVVEIAYNYNNTIDYIAQHNSSDFYIVDKRSFLSPIPKKFFGSF